MKLSITHTGVFLVSDWYHFFIGIEQPELKPNTWSGCSKCLQSPKQYLHVCVSVVLLLLVWIGFSLLLRTFFFEDLAKSSGLIVSVQCSLTPPIFHRCETSLLWVSRKPAGSIKLFGHSGFCWDTQLCGSNASCRGLQPETFSRGGSAWRVYPLKSRRGWKAHQVWWNSGKTWKVPLLCKALK